MNPLNYASLEASHRLVEAGIKLETEAVWVRHGLSKKWNVELSSDYLLRDEYECIPAPCMAEVWRELPEQEHTVRYGAYLELSKTVGIDTGELTYAAYMRDGIASCDYANTNPTDALIDLLIWVRKEKKDD